MLVHIVININGKALGYFYFPFIRDGNNSWLNGRTWENLIHLGDSSLWTRARQSCGKHKVSPTPRRVQYGIYLLIKRATVKRWRLTKGKFSPKRMMDWVIDTHCKCWIQQNINQPCYIIIFTLVHTLQTALRYTFDLRTVCTGIKEIK